MKAEELRPGDVLLASEGNPSDHVIVYEITKVDVSMTTVYADVRFHKGDAGRLSTRSWPIGSEVPHVRLPR